MATDKKNIARWQPQSSRGIVTRIIATGTLVLETPAHFGAGEQSGNDLVILEDVLEKKPLIPGASLAGALRHYLWQREKGYRSDFSPDKKSYAERLFGTALEPDSGHQSRVIVDDALGDGSLTIRDGVKIDGVTRTAEDGALFTVQVWERGTTFDLRFELCIYEDDVRQGQSVDLEQAFAVALHALGTGEIPLGARKHRGYGRASVSDWDIQNYEMQKASDFSAWLTGNQTGNILSTFIDEDEVKQFDDKRQFLRINATLNLCDSLLIRAGSDVAKVSHLTSKGKPVVSGTSIIGALRARALKIAQSINYERAQDLINDMFGKHGSNEEEEDGNKTASDNDMSASRVTAEERLIENPNFDYIQNRIKIDRFTGGAYDTALFTEQPVFANDDTGIIVNLDLRFPDNYGDDKYRLMIDAQAGLLMLVLKDLWTEDLPLGGESSIGRGRLRGNNACIELKTDVKYPKIELNQNGLVDASQGAILQEKVDALWKYLGGEA